MANDDTGDKRSMEEWEKVWSDLKNDTKLKAVEIQQATKTGGGPACLPVLSDLEQRVLNLIDHQAATGLVDVQEVGAEPGAFRDCAPEQAGSQEPFTPHPSAADVHVQSFTPSPPLARRSASRSPRRRHSVGSSRRRDSAGPSRSPPRRYSAAPSRSPPRRDSVGPSRSPRRRTSAGPTRSPPRRDSVGPSRSPRRRTSAGPTRSPPRRDSVGPSRSPRRRTSAGPTRSPPRRDSVGPSRSPRRRTSGRPTRRLLTPRRPRSPHSARRLLTPRRPRSPHSAHRRTSRHSGARLSRTQVLDLMWLQMCRRRSLMLLFLSCVF